MMDKPTILTIKDYSDIQDAHKRGECTVRIFNWDRVMSKKQWLIVNKISGFDGTEAWVETNHRDFYEAYDQVLDVQWIADDLLTRAATPPTGAPAAGEGEEPPLTNIPNWADVYSTAFEKYHGHSPLVAGEGRSLKVGQLVRYAGNAWGDIPYGTFGVVVGFDPNIDFFVVRLFDVDGDRVIKNTALQTVVPETVNRVEKEVATLQADNARLADELARARAECEEAAIALKACVKVLELGELPSSKPRLRDFEIASAHDKAVATWEVVSAADKAVENYYTLKAQS